MPVEGGGLAASRKGPGKKPALGGRSLQLTLHTGQDVLASRDGEWVYRAVDLTTRNAPGLRDGSCPRTLHLARRALRVDLVERQHGTCLVLVEHFR